MRANTAAANHRKGLGLLSLFSSRCCLFGPSMSLPKLPIRSTGAPPGQPSAPPEPAWHTFDTFEADDDGRRKLTRRFIQVVVKHMRDGADPPLSLRPADLRVDDAHLQVLVRAGFLARDETWEPESGEMMPVPDEVRKLCLNPDEAQALRALEPRIEEAWPDADEEPRPARRRSMRLRGKVRPRPPRSRAPSPCSSHPFPSALAGARDGCACRGERIAHVRRSLCSPLRSCSRRTTGNEAAKERLSGAGDGGDGGDVEHCDRRQLAASRRGV